MEREANACRSRAEEEKAAALKAAQEHDERMARDRFGNAKSISSAQFEDNNDEFRNQENQVILACTVQMLMQAFKNDDPEAFRSIRLESTMYDCVSKSVMSAECCSAQRIKACIPETACDANSSRLWLHHIWQA